MNSRFALSILMIVLGSLLSLSPGRAQAMTCSEAFQGMELNTQAGQDLGPIEWIRNIKNKILPAKALRQFDAEKYKDSLELIRQNDLRVETGFTPRNLEEAIAYLDARLESSSISVQEMPPVMRLKVYKSVSKILESQGRNSTSDSQKLAQIIFRGNRVKPTSFAFLLTHAPKTVAHEMFAQHLQTLVVTETVTAAFDYEGGPKKPGMMTRLTPQFLRNHKEALSAGFWASISLGSMISSAKLDALFAPSFNVFKLYKNKVQIEESLVQKGPEATLQEQESAFESRLQFNYYYAVIEKGINWYFFGTLLFAFL